MSARTDFEKLKDQARAKTLEIMEQDTPKETTSVDKTLEALAENISVQKKEERNTKELVVEKPTEPVQLKGNFALKFKAKESKTEHKNFLIPKSVNDKLVQMAKQSGVSENEIVNEILKQALMN